MASALLDCTQSLAPAAPMLSPGLVHVRLLDLHIPPDRIDSLERQLSDDEIRRADRFRSAEDRNKFVAARGGLREVLAGAIHRDAGGLVFGYGPHGKPFLPGHDVCFNLAHAGDLAMVAMSIDREVGVDIERSRRGLNPMLLAERVFSARERRRLESLPETLRDAYFLRIWTLKEAYVKAIGAGLSHPLSGLDIDIDPLATKYERGGTEFVEGGIAARELSVAPDYFGAVAASGLGWRIVWPGAETGGDRH